MIGVCDVSASLGSQKVLRRVSLDVHKGEVVALAGPSGSGKTTLLRVILGLTTPNTGTVTIEDRQVSRANRILIPAEERGLAAVFQDLALWPHMTVQGNLAFALRSRNSSQKQRNERIAAVLARVELADKALHRPAELSGGERQRVALARALVQEPHAILLDEPLVGIDALLKREMLAFLHEIFRERSCPVLCVTHDGVEAAALADRVVVLERGEVVQQGSFEELRTEPKTDFVRAFSQRWPGSFQ